MIVKQDPDHSQLSTYSYSADAYIYSYSSCALHTNELCTRELPFL